MVTLREWGDLTGDPAGRTHESGRVKGSPAPIEGRCGARLRKSDPPRYCAQYPLEGKTRCKLHGGASLSGPNHANWKHGKYDGTLPSGLAKHYSAARANADLVAHTEEIALVDAKIFEDFEKLATGESPGAWNLVAAIGEDLRDSLADFNAARRQADGLTMTTALQGIGKSIDRLLEVATKGVDQGRAWNGIVSNIQLRRKLVDSEVRRQKAAHDVITKHRALALIAFITQSVLRHVKDQDAKRAIVDDIRLVMAGKDTKAVSGA